MVNENAVRQRWRRDRLRREGRVEATVVVPADQADRLRFMAEALDRGDPVSPRLIPALQVLKGLRDALSAHGIARAGVFGSTARGADTAESDLDVVLTLADGAEPDPLDLIKVDEMLRAAFAARMPGVGVDVSLRADMRESVRRRCDAEAVYAD
jgi:predicted nucleotidyltransferase